MDLPDLVEYRRSPEGVNGALWGMRAPGGDEISQATSFSASQSSVPGPPLARSLSAFCPVMKSSPPSP